jgi:hypothetical protein
VDRLFQPLHARPAERRRVATAHCESVMWTGAAKFPHESRNRQPAPPPVGLATLRSWRVAPRPQSFNCQRDHPSRCCLDQRRPICRRARRSSQRRGRAARRC